MSNEHTAAERPSEGGSGDSHEDGVPVGERRERRKNENREKAAQRESLSAAAVYEIISREGTEEMERPLTSLWWSGVGAGLGISASLYVMAALRVSLEGIPGAEAIEKLGYCFGFLIVILGRLQLFTENTITPILPALRHRDAEMFHCVARLWTVVFFANLVGTFVAVLLPWAFPIGSSDQIKAMLEISLHFAERGYAEVFFSAIPAGFLIAVMVWMLPASKHFEFWTISAITYAIAIADTSHVIVGSSELFFAVLQGESDPLAALARLLLAGAGNVVGGTGLFAVLAYAQVSEEV